jgi:hypothetical protein
MQDPFNPNSGPAQIGAPSVQVPFTQPLPSATQAVPQMGPGAQFNQRMRGYFNTIANSSDQQGAMDAAMQAMASMNPQLAERVRGMPPERANQVLSQYVNAVRGGRQFAAIDEAVNALGEMDRQPAQQATPAPGAPAAPGNPFQQRTTRSLFRTSGNSRSGGSSSSTPGRSESSGSGSSLSSSVGGALNAFGNNSIARIAMPGTALAARALGGAMTNSDPNSISRGLVAGAIGKQAPAPVRDAKPTPAKQAAAAPSKTNYSLSTANKSRSSGGGGGSSKSIGSGRTTSSGTGLKSGGGTGLKSGGGTGLR